MHMTMVNARETRRTRKRTPPPILRRSPRSNGLPIGKRRAEKAEKAKERARKKAEEKSTVEDSAKTDM